MTRPIPENPSRDRQGAVSSKISASSAKPTRSHGSSTLQEDDIPLAYLITWARHCSTKYLWKQEAVEAAVHYVLHEQGESMAVFSRLQKQATP